MLAIVVAIASPARALVVGDVVVADPDSVSAPGRVIRVDSATGQQTLVAQAGLLDQPLFVVTAANGDLLVSDLAGLIVRIDGQSGVQSKVADVPAPFGLALAPSGYLYVTSGEHVVRVDPSSGASATVPEGAPFGELEGIAAGPDGALYVVDLGAMPTSSGDERIVRIDPTSGAQQPLSIGGYLAWPRGIVFTPPGNLLVADQDAFGLNGAVLSVSAVGGSQGIVSQSTLFNNPQVVAAAPGGAPIYVTDIGDPGVTGDEAVFRIDAQGATSPLSQNGFFHLPWGVAVVGTVTCGDGQRDPGEQCDAGAMNGAAGACCTKQCLFVQSGTVCRSADTACDAIEVCDGLTGTCPADARVPADTACDNGNDCSLADACTADGVCADGPQCAGVTLAPGEVRGAAKPVKVAVVLADAAGTGKPFVEAVGLARAPGATLVRVVSAPTQEVTNHVMRALKRRRPSKPFRAKFRLRLTRDGRRRLADEGTLDVHIVVTVTDRAGAKTQREVDKQWTVTKR